jgi:hypothetical protein
MCRSIGHSLRQKATKKTRLNFVKFLQTLCITATKIDPLIEVTSVKLNVHKLDFETNSRAYPHHPGEN